MVIVLTACAKLIVLKLGRNVRLLDTLIIVDRVLSKIKYGAFVELASNSFIYFNHFILLIFSLELRGVI